MAYVPDNSESLGPAFSKSRVLTLANMPDAEKEAFLTIFAEQKMTFFRDADGMYVSNVRMFDPNIVDLAPKVPAARKEAKAKDATRKSSVTLADSDTFPAFGGAASLDYSAYPRFTSLIAPLETVRPKSKTRVWLMRLIEEIYDQR